MSTLIPTTLKPYRRGDDFVTAYGDVRTKYVHVRHAGSPRFTRIKSAHFIKGYVPTTPQAFKARDKNTGVLILQ